MRVFTFIFILWVLSLNMLAQCGGTNLVTNGNFSAGNTGFSTSYTYNPSNCYTEGHYSIASSGSAVHGSFCTTGDHTSGSGLYMIVNGAPSSINVWCQTMTVTPNTWYRFSFWGMNVCAVCSDNPQFSISINGVPASNPCATFVFDTRCSWKYYEVYWNSMGATSANICIINLNTYLGGNDFALDDIEFRSCSSGGPCIAFPLDAPVLEYAKTESNQVQLGFWIDEYLSTNSTIYVERSTNNTVNFEEIGTVQNIKIGTNVFTDKYPVFEQEMYYRLKSIDKDGTAHYSNIRSARVKNEVGEKITVYPNPARYAEVIVLEYHGESQKIMNIMLTDMSGKVLYHQENAGILFDNGQMRIPVELVSGCYTLTIRLSDKVHTQKLLVY